MDRADLEDHADAANVLPQSGKEVEAIGKVWYRKSKRTVQPGYLRGMKEYYYYENDKMRCLRRK